MAYCIDRFSRGVADQVLALLEEEREEWLRRLHWDRTIFTRNAARQIRQGKLQGWLLRVDEDPVAVILAGERGRFRSLETPYVAFSHRRRGNLARLLEGVLDEVLSAAAVERVEIGFFPFEEEAPDSVIGRRGFQASPRTYMVGDLEQVQSPAARAGLPDGVELAPWPVHPDPLARLLQAAYRGTPDSRSASFYGTSGGCAAYLEALVAGEECGRFEADLSGLAVARDDGPVGFLLGTRVSQDTAHVAQVAVLPRWRRQGIASTLLDHYGSRGRALGLKRSTLLVTDANSLARAWYQRRGHHACQRFLTYSWQRSGQPIR